MKIEDLSRTLDARITDLNINLIKSSQVLTAYINRTNDECKWRNKLSITFILILNKNVLLTCYIKWKELQWLFTQI